MCLLFSLINNVSVFRTILEKIGLQGKVTPLQAKKKWDNLKKIYKVCPCIFKYTLFVLTMQVNHAEICFDTAVVNCHD